MRKKQYFRKNPHFNHEVGWLVTANQTDMSPSGADLPGLQIAGGKRLSL